MADFHSSTHRAKWIFTPQQLVEKFKVANQRAIETLEKVWERLWFNCTPFLCAYKEMFAAYG
ncbi:hypothetical protein SLEP1_g15042 [Rubroshorea leprosula]|uniref:Transposase n=1 Tax=Rubroshorea leprosula TaxID=152421 RepID=A0AAV5IS70_9ROSI|nr:hypothetical protein SLEP1_g15042 [Rubroshorea leprosula]